jgi:geranylgeranyl pyrophosphate synthase
LKSGRVTLPLIAALGNASPRERGRIEEIVFGGGLMDGMWDEMVAFIDAKGGVDYCLERAAHHAREAAAIAGELPVDSDSRDALTTVVGQVVRRRR